MKQRQEEDFYYALLEESQNEQRWLQNVEDKVNLEDKRPEIKGNGIKIRITLKWILTKNI